MAIPRVAFVRVVPMRTDSTRSTSSNPTTDVSMETIVKTLASRRRRRVLETISSRPGTDLEELAVAVVARAGGTDRRRSDVDELRTVLHHVDLPALADAGLVDINVEDRTVCPRRPRIVDATYAAIRHRFVLPDR